MLPWTLVKSVSQLSRKNRSTSYCSNRYDYSLDYLTDKDVVSLDGTTEHIDLKEGNHVSRILLLKPNKIEFRLHLSGYPKGEYEITLSPAIVGYDLGLQRMELIIE